ncbi:30S ribosomal protein S7 [Candidatus Methylomirabilis lanthanidiphila]|uniref:Small ribosomal subunit protein uS7 n=1 Tax=Candidatus Methylomirabilis lanthanidiphila TaxID=2211376 RepID=A0A564ZNY0_9BACT|nr:30S ribosomal protein S7 [Candidatus Methylomirabilis lanthanidiphila]VUZ86557.1 30S ribosomal protein S7 [Candidatus Methylomirabilis lanthanidiphila]
MPRRKVTDKREIAADAVYNNRMVAKFINTMMVTGKKSIAESIIYRSMKIVEDRAKTDPLRLFKQAIDNVKPVLEVKSRRVGGATYQVPVEVRAERRTSLAFRWIIGFSRKRTEKSMAERLAAELIEAAANRGSSVKKKEDTHKMAEANKAFAHYRW